IVAGAKREPSSLVQLQTQSGTSVSMPASLSVRTTSSAASVHSTPSYLPPVGWVSRCEPSPTGGLALSRPLRTPNIEPSPSTCTSRPAASQARRNQSRTCLSSCPSVSRRTPPLGVRPNFAVSWMVSHKRAESICRLDAFLVIQASGIAGLFVAGLHGRTIAHDLSRHGAGDEYWFEHERAGRGDPAEPSGAARLPRRQGGHDLGRRQRLCAGQSRGPAGEIRLRLPSLLPAQSKTVPDHRDVRRRQSHDPLARRRSRHPHRCAALPRLARRRGDGRADRYHCALARRSCCLRARLLLLL